MTRNPVAVSSSTETTTPVGVTSALAISGKVGSGSVVVVVGTVVVVVVVDVVIGVGDRRDLRSGVSGAGPDEDDENQEKGPHSRAG